MKLIECTIIGLFIFAKGGVDGANKIDTEIDNAFPTFAEPYFLNIASISRSSNNRKEKQDWCKMANPKTSLAGDHSMCIYPKGKFGKECGAGGSESAFRKYQIDEIIKEHNKWRARVAKGDEIRGAPGPQPPASNMKALQWDDELAQIAERWAYQCSGGHDQNRVSQRFQVGQNVAKQSMWSYGQEIQLEVDWATPIKNWYDEVQQFDKNSQKGLGESDSMMYRMRVGHYSALVWADTYLVGCAAVKWYADSSKMGASIIYVCNYGPAGNYVNQPLYKVGKACSACDGDFPKCNDNLCYPSTSSSSAKARHDKGKKRFIPWRLDIHKGYKKRRNKYLKQMKGRMINTNKKSKKNWRMRIGEELENEKEKRRIRRKKYEMKKEAAKKNKQLRNKDGNEKKTAKKNKYKQEAFRLLKRLYALLKHL